MTVLKTSNLFFTLLSVIVFSCNSAKTDDAVDDNTDDNNVKSNQAIVNADLIFSQLPMRDVVVGLVQLSKAEYNPETLNNPDNTTSYFSESKKALNLGVYGTDLNITNVFDQAQESNLFLSCVNSLAKDLGVGSAFDEKMIGRMEANRENKDSTLEIISGAFKTADSFLKANNRSGTSSLMIAGIWIEGVYCGCKTAQETSNDSIVKTIFGQKKSLTPLIKLCESTSINNDAKYIIDDLKLIETIMNKKNDGVYNLEALTELSNSINTLRTKITSTK